MNKDVLEIVNALKREDRSVQKMVFLKFHQSVMSIALRYSKNYQDAEEIVNDVFLKIFKKIDSYNQDYALSTWINRIAVNAAIDRYRKNTRMIKLEFVDKDQVAQEDSNHILFKTDHNEILPVIQKLPEKYRMVFNLYVFEEFTHKEIAQNLHISLGSSKSYLKRAKDIIRTHFHNSKQKIYSHV